MSFQPYPAVSFGCCNNDYEDVSMADGVDGLNSLKLNGPTQPNEFNDGELDFREV